jgi:VIT1/CCC1 family predicted Fe2+/Mn2+ transporter
VAAYKVWWGEWGPPARYLVPIVPLAAGSLGCWLARASTRARIVTGLLWGVGMALTLIGYQDPQRFYHHPDGVNKLVQRLGELFGVDLARALVAFQPYSLAAFPARLWISLFALTLTIAVTALLNPGTLRHLAVRLRRSAQSRTRWR